MIVETVDLEHFMSYGTTSTVNLPGKGVVLVTGPNGSGKSSLIEALAVAGWGKTLRGTSPWQDGQAGKVALCTDDLVVERTHSVKGTSKLRWSYQNQPVVQYETTTKAQAALERVLGSFESWRRTCVFSAQDAAHFTLATDGERKRLLEQLLGLERFDVALEACRRDLKEANLAESTARREHLVQHTRVQGEKERRQRAQAELDGLPAIRHPSAECEAKVAELDEMVKRIDADVRKAETKLRAAEKFALEVDVELRSAQRELVRVQNGQCGTCGRAWDAAHLATATQAVEDARRRQAATVEEFATTRKNLEAELEELGEDRAQASGERSTWFDRMHKARRVEMDRSRCEGVLSSAIEDHTAAQQRLAELQTEVDAAVAKVAEIAAAEKVLGLAGVRTTLLANALGGIEHVANVWLGRIAGWGIRLELKPYAEKAGGGVKDAISLQVHGAGGGHGYKGASAGQRRRLDVALLLALAEVATSVSGRAPSTLWFDEVFDALDTDGVDAVCTVLEELARDRAVVVISHNPLLEQRLARHAVSARFEVAQGVVTEVRDLP